MASARALAPLAVSDLATAVMILRAYGFAKSFRCPPTLLGAPWLSYDSLENKRPDGFWRPGAQQ